MKSCFLPLKLVLTSCVHARSLLGVSYIHTLANNEDMVRFTLLPFPIWIPFFQPIFISSFLLALVGMQYADVSRSLEAGSPWFISKVSIHFDP
jgi:hypothetical protein